MEHKPVLEHVDIIEHNAVVVPAKKGRKKKFLYEQFLFFRQGRGKDGVKLFDLVGYYYVTDKANSSWELDTLPKDRVSFTFTTRQGTLRRVIAKSYTTSETDFDPEMEDRECGQEEQGDNYQRQCLFGLDGFGDVRGE